MSISKLPRNLRRALHDVTQTFHLRAGQPMYRIGVLHSTVDLKQGFTTWRRSHKATNSLCRCLFVNILVAISYKKIQTCANAVDFVGTLKPPNISQNSGRPASLGSRFINAAALSENPTTELGPVHASGGCGSTYVNKASRTCTTRLETTLPNVCSIEQYSKRTLRRISLLSSKEEGMGSVRL